MPSKSALEEYKSILEKKNNFEKGQLLMSANNNNDKSVNKGNCTEDSLVDRREIAARFNQGMGKQLVDDPVFEMGNAPEDEPQSSSWLSWIPSIWCCAS